MTSTDRAGYTKGLRILADVLELDPDLPLPHGEISFFVQGMELEPALTLRRMLDNPKTTSTPTSETFPEQMQIPLLDLHAQQATWRAEWATEFQDYLRTRKGEPDAHVNGEWPVQAPPTGWNPATLPTARVAA
jgi:hypothetical protein